METFGHWPLVLQAVIAAAVAVAIIVGSLLFGQRGKRNVNTDLPYECGLIPASFSNGKFSVKFYVTGLLFLLLDVEVVFLLPWAVCYRAFLAEHIAVVMPIFFFLILLFAGLLYEIKKGALKWED